MKSICIKTNYTQSIEYILDKLKYSNINNIYFSYKQFKKYKNIIIHYVGKNEQTFFHEISSILSTLVIDLFEKKIIDAIIEKEYFYFNTLEKNQISNITQKQLYDKYESLYPQNTCFYLLHNNFYNYLITNKSIVLNGFITFRIKDYIENIFCQIDKSVTNYLIEREYNDFITLLKIYINSEKCNSNIVHLIYYNTKSILLDENKNIIKLDDNMFNAKYLSDISFSSSDYTLNTLLTLLPSKIYFHKINLEDDEFIKTIKLIFDDRVIICKDCDICNFYKRINKNEPI